MRLFKILSFSVIILGLMMYKAQAQMHSSETDHSDHAITILAEDYAFDAPDEIPSGWTTIEYTNEGEEPHLLVLGLMPEGKTFEDYAGEVLPPFDEAWHTYAAGEIDLEEFVGRFEAESPEWFGAVKYMGGSGLIDPGLTSEVTVNLQPGTYYLECYVKTEEGEFHIMEGMGRELIVTEAPSTVERPEAGINITLTNFEMTIDGELTPGMHTVAVHMTEQPEEGLPHNVHVARIGPNVDVDELVRWVNWLAIDGMQVPAPTSFVGGINILEEGETGYFTLDLEPGRYLFLSENTGHLGVMQEVTIEP